MILTSIFGILLGNIFGLGLVLIISGLAFNKAQVKYGIYVVGISSLFIAAYLYLV